MVNFDPDFFKDISELLSDFGSEVLEDVGGELLDDLSAKASSRRKEAKRDGKATSRSISFTRQTSSPAAKRAKGRAQRGARHNVEINVVSTEETASSKQQPNAAASTAVSTPSRSVTHEGMTHAPAAPEGPQKGEASSLVSALSAVADAAGEKVRDEVPNAYEMRPEKDASIIEKKEAVRDALAYAPKRLDTHASPQAMRQAIVMSEVLKRPRERGRQRRERWRLRRERSQVSKP